MRHTWIGTGPIIIRTDTWVLIRNDKRTRAAVVQLIDRGGPHQHYRVVSFAPGSDDRRLLGRYTSLEAAEDSVRYVVPPRAASPPKGDAAFGAYGGASVWPPERPAL